MQPLLPSLLYTQASKKVEKEIEDELQLPDPDIDEAQEAIAKEILDES